MKAFLINLFSKNTGAIARALAGLLMGCITALLARFGFDLSVEDTAKLSSAVTGGTMWLIGEVMTYLENQNIKALQEAIKVIAPEVTSDSHVGPVTLAAVERAAEAIKTIKMNAVGGNTGEKEAAKTVTLAMKPD